MKKPLIILLLTALCSGMLPGQSFDWNLRGGLNIMDSKSHESNLSLTYHAGLQAGIRIASFGIYGEALYSLLEDQYGGDPIGYFTPSLLLKGYALKFMFFEFGGTMLSMVGDSGHEDDILNPNGGVYLAAGLGIHVSRVEVSLRSTAKQGYGVMQLTAALKF